MADESDLRARVRALAAPLISRPDADRDTQPGMTPLAYAQLVAQARGLTASNPEVVARVLTAWMDEQWPTS